MQMTKVQKITLSPSQDIPFNKLVLSQSNVRRVKAGVSIEQLAESIAQRTLLQSLSVRAVVDAEGNETGMFEVPAGGRRYRALELLVKQKRMAKTQPVPCVVREGGIAEDDSLAENDERVGLHPLDQFRAFKTLSDTGLSEEDIAARHFVSPAIVKQRLRLASVSPKLHEVYAEDGMTLEQLMAFSVTADQVRQEQVWENVSRSGYDEPYQIRRMLTEQTVREPITARNLLGLTPTSRRVAVFCEIYSSTTMAVGFRISLYSTVDLTIEEQATIDALNAEQAKLEFDYQDADELPDDVDQRLSQIEAALMAFEERSIIYDPHRSRRRLRQHRFRRTARGGPGLRPIGG
jgi:ParB family transcriptional regulator, chromosome partitioning protein